MPPSTPQNQNQFFGIKVSKPGINVNNASDKQLTYQNNFNSTTFYDQSNARMIEGLLPDGTYGLWVSKPGFDVTDLQTEVNNNLTFNSEGNTFKIGISGPFTFPSQGSIGPNGNLPVSGYYTTQIAHGLGIVPLVAIEYIPLPAISSPWGVEVYVPATGGDGGYGYSISDANSVIYTIVAGVDDTYLYLGEAIFNGDVSNTYPTVSQSFNYYVYAPTASN